MASAGCILERVNLTGFILVSFVALHRTGEAVGFKVSQIRYFHHANTIIPCVTSFKDSAAQWGSKTGAGGRPKRFGSAYETDGWQVIRRVFDVSVQNFGQDLDDLPCEMRWHCKHLTAYGLRRGGVNWHCVTLDSMDATTYMDRWALSRTARQKSVKPWWTQQG